MVIDQVLEKYNLKYSDLNAVERETLGGWLDSLQKGTVSVEKIRDYIKAMRDSVELDLSKVSHGCKQDIFLKARVRNYLLLEAFLISPEKAKQAIERSIASLSKNASKDVKI